jgi:hypothetical protein
MERYRGAMRLVFLRAPLLSLRAILSPGLQSITDFSRTGFSLFYFLGGANASI